MDKTSNTLFKNQINEQTRMILWYELAFYIPIFIYMVFKITTSDATFDQLKASLLGSGMPMILGIGLGMIVILIYRKKDLFLRDLFKKNKKMEWKTFFKILLPFSLIQVILILVTIGSEKLFNSFGYTMIGDLESANSGNIALSLILYAFILGPITEEIVFRGALLRSLEKHGKLFAIIVSSIFFGVYHGSFVQGFFAAVSSLILGYVTIEYSIKWSMIIHIINNLFFVNILGFIMDSLSPNFQGIFNLFLFIALFLGGAYVLFQSRDFIKNYIKINRSEEKLYRYTFSSPWVILFISVNLLLAINLVINGIEKII